eukprot:scaffold51715_cov17-Tisochrysis_lutea.AAC.1
MARGWPGPVCPALCKWQQLVFLFRLQDGCLGCDELVGSADAKVLVLALLVQAEVSDAAAGGQILMEGSTFTAIKDVLGELGTVDAQVEMRKLIAPSIKVDTLTNASQGKEGLLLEANQSLHPNICR